MNLEDVKIIAREIFIDQVMKSDQITHGEAVTVNKWFDEVVEAAWIAIRRLDLTKEK